MSKCISKLFKPGISWAVEVHDNGDLVVRNVRATSFGGKYDKGDNGQTESGLIDDDSTSLIGVALPIRSTESATRNSPLANPTKAHIPWKSKVKIWIAPEGEEAAIEAILIDNGPDVSKYPTHAIDLNDQLVKKYFAKVDSLEWIANNWSANGVSYRIIGGAAFV